MSTIKYYWVKRCLTLEIRSVSKDFNNSKNAWSKDASFAVAKENISKGVNGTVLVEKGSFNSISVLGAGSSEEDHPISYIKSKNSVKSHQFCIWHS